jgi:predicted MPP superfamily phosphohydrolase
MATNKPYQKLIIGIGDLHGHYPALELLLNELQKEYGIFNGNELKDNVQLVFTGDYIDRGKFNRKVLERMIELSKDKNVVQLFGNHELLALSGLGVAQRLAKKKADVYEYVNNTLHGMNGGGEFVKEFGEGAEALQNYVKAMSKEGEIGAWMRKLKPFYQVNVGEERILFVHGGIPESFEAPDSLDRYQHYFLNKMAMKTQVAGGNTKKYLESERLGEKSPFWDRRMHSMSKEAIAESLGILDLDKVIIAHTPHARITNYYDRVFDIDVGMTPAYRENTPAAIVLKLGGVYAFYAGKGEEKLADIDSGRTLMIGDK